MRRGSNLPAVGTYNQTLVLDLIRRAPDGLSRVELARDTGLSPQTLSNVARKLVDEGLVHEGERIVSGPGKPRTLLRMNPQSRYAVGVHLDPAVDTYVLVDMAGHIVAHTELEPRRSGTPAELVATVADTINALLDGAGVPRERVLGVGVAAPGPIDSERGALLEPPLLPAWHNVGLRDALCAATGLGAMIEKDVVAAMVGELWVDATHALSDALFVYYGAGIGVGLAVDGAPVRGRTGNAGDVAHLVVEPGGPLCPCGQRGCFGVAVAPERLIADTGVADEPTLARLTPSDARGALDRIREQTERGEPRSIAVIERTAAAFAAAIVLVNNLLDADAAVIGGPMWSRLAPVLDAPLARALAGSALHTTTRPVRLTEAQLGTDVAAVGAACLVLDSVFTARPAGLMITAN